MSFAFDYLLEKQGIQADETVQMEQHCRLTASWEVINILLIWQIEAYFNI